MARRAAKQRRDIESPSRGRRVRRPVPGDKQAGRSPRRRSSPMQRRGRVIIAIIIVYRHSERGAQNTHKVSVASDGR